MMTVPGTPLSHELTTRANLRVSAPPPPPLLFPPPVNDIDILPDPGTFNTAETPEPGTFALMALSLLPLAGKYWKQHVKGSHPNGA